MSFLWEALIKSLKLIFSFNQEIYGIVFRSLRFSFLATAISVIFGLPLGMVIGLKRFYGRSFLLLILNTTMALPTVVVGLIGYSFLSRSAPLGFLEWMFTPKAVILGEFLLSLPIIINLTIAAVQSIDPRALLTSKTLGAGRIQTFGTILLEARFALLAAIIVGYGRAVSEVGAAMMLGGNIRFYTRTMTTAIALETSKGNFGFGLSLGFFLLLFVFIVNLILFFLQAKGYRGVQVQ